MCFCARLRLTGDGPVSPSDLINHPVKVAKEKWTGVPAKLKVQKKSSHLLRLTCSVIRMRRHVVVVVVVAVAVVVVAPVVVVVVVAVVVLKSYGEKP